MRRLRSAQLVVYCTTVRQPPTLIYSQRSEPSATDLGTITEMGLRSRFGDIQQRFRRLPTRETEAASFQEAVIFENCAGRSLAMEILEDLNATVTCAFPEDIHWYQITSKDNNCIPEQCQQTEGAAAVKLSLNIADHLSKALTQVRCRIQFSQTTYDDIRVHECWPQVIAGQQSFKQISQGIQANPSIEASGVALTVGEAHRNIEETRPSAWTFIARPSPSSAETGSWQNVVTLDWRAPGKSDHAIWSMRPMYAAAVLVCLEGSLTIEASIHKDIVKPHPRAKADVHLRNGSRLSPEFKMRTQESGKALELEILCTDVQAWTRRKNHMAVPEGVLPEDIKCKTS
jgi:hypothetical protein